MALAQPVSALPATPAPVLAPRELAARVNTRFRAEVVRVGPGAGLRLPAATSGFPALDVATGLGGWPRGRLSKGFSVPGRRERAAGRAARLMWWQLTRWARSAFDWIQRVPAADMPATGSASICRTVPGRSTLFAVRLLRVSSSLTAMP